MQRKRVMSRPSPSPPVSMIDPSHAWFSVFLFVFLFAFVFFFLLLFFALLSLLVVVVAFFVLAFLFSFAHRFFIFVSVFFAFALLCRSLGRMWRRCARSLFRCCRRLGCRWTLGGGRRGSRSAQLPRQWLRSRARGCGEGKKFGPFLLRDQRHRHSLSACPAPHVNNNNKQTMANYKQKIEMKNQKRK